jgi:HK97 family phage major capsid protein
VPYNNLITRSGVGALIPEEVSQRVLEGAVRQSAALTIFPRVMMSRAQLRIPVVSALPTAYFVNGDTGIKQTTEMSWANKFLNAEELAAIVPIPEAVLDDSEFDAWGSVAPRLEEAIGRALDAAVFFGTNKPASWPTAVVTNAVSAGNTVTVGSAAAAGGYAGDLSLMLSTLEADGYDANALLANRVVKGILRNARNTTGENLGELSFDADGTPQIYGLRAQFPMRGLWPSGAAATQAIALDTSEFMLGVRQDITYKVLDQAVIQDAGGVIQYNLAQQDMIALRVVFRVAWQVANVINYDQTVEANRYPAAVLRTA